MQLHEKIPNNVDLHNNRRLQRALEKWQPNYLKWWKEAGPADFQVDDIYLRTAISVDAKGWANFDYVKMPDYKWGIFLSIPEQDRQIPCGDFFGKPAWQEVPGEFRNALRRIIVTQGDTEPASVEQQRLLCGCAPSLYDCRNLFQVNVEEGRHLWAMVYLLHAYFGRDGREEAEELLERRSGDFDKPRILTTFNEPIDDWLSFFMFTMFTDRDGKYQLLALAESAFDPLSRTTRFMLTEEAHHMFVGETGVGRVVTRACQLMKQDKNEDARAQGGVDLPTVQRYINFWYSSSLDLFGGEISSNAADYFASGLKGRAHEMKKFDDHVALAGHYEMELLEGGSVGKQFVPMRNAMNEILRDAYVDDNQRGVDRWNKMIAEEGIDFTLRLPSRRFNRKMGVHSGHSFDVEGNPISPEEFEARRDEWLPTEADRAYIRSLMQPVLEPGKMANWVAAPARGINAKPLDFEYVRQGLRVRRCLLAPILLAAAVACGSQPPPPALPAAADLTADPQIRRMIEELQGAAGREPQNPAVWVALGMAFEANEFYEQAAVSYLHATRLDETEPRHWYLLGSVYASAGTMGSADEPFAEAARLAPDYAPVYWRRGFVLLSLSRLDDAEASFRRALELPDGEAPGRIGLARVFLQRGDAANAAAAAAELERVLERDPANAYARHLLGTAYRSLGRLDDAERELLRGDGRAPSWVDPWRDSIARFHTGRAVEVERAQSAVDAGRPEQAIPVLEARLAEEPDNFDLMNSLGAAYLVAGRAADAAELLERAYAINPAKYVVRMNLAAAYLGQNDFERALTFAEEAIEANPVQPRPQELKGIILMSTGRPAEALDALDAARRYDPENVGLLLRVAALQFRLERWEAARDSYADAAARLPGQGDLQLALGWCQLEVGDHAAARTALERARELGVRSAADLERAFGRLEGTAGGAAN